MPGKALIIIPTYNEMENITRLIPAVYQYTDSNVHILVVDDNSPDGTGGYIKELSEKDERIHLLSRPKKMGLGTAYTDGFRYAIKNGYDFIFEMDADFSHDPKELPVFLREIENADLVLGSRYLTGVNVINWPMQRLLLSWFANQYTRFITGMPVHDSTGGYKCFRREVLESINLDKITSNGYAFQIELNFKTWKKGFRIKEIPIIFVDRYMGKSKMSKKIVREAVTLVWKLRIMSIFGRIQ
ncbi:MAG: polyprenol monophosphomannose synthase [Ignavibacteriales bacterium]|nr:Polyprenol monophosphomannose synthase [Ignavibacteriaceae bacterium]MCK6614496.1 polyprenol monophosphomannose synthase [Ignavibacteriaceae bacterium]QOJ29767.1 MAG: polyprenol monophosphomannose synthase [Ignavibacteriales bacterium]